jgi:hypothetical protein
MFSSWSRRLVMIMRLASSRDKSQVDGEPTISP